MSTNLIKMVNIRGWGEIYSYQTMLITENIPSSLRNGLLMNEGLITEL